MRLLSVYLQLCILTHVATAQHQLAFGLHTGQTLRQHQQQQDTPPPPQLITEPDPPSSSLSSQHLLDLALSLLDSLTLYSTLSTHPPQTSYLPHLISLSSLSNSNSSILDSLDPDSIPARTLRLTKEYLNRIYAGKPRSQREKGGLGGSDYSVRGVLIGLKNAVERFEKDTKAVVSEIGGQGKHTKGSRDPKEWRERLKIAGGVGTSAHGMLNEEETREGMKEVERLLEISAEKGSGEAWTLLGDLYLTGHLTLGVNTSRSVEFYTLASEQTGNSQAQYKLGFLYGTNYGSAFPELRSEGRSQQGSSLLHYTFSALSGHVPARMTVGYRHWAGIGTKQSCKDALPWYKSAADSAIRTFNSGPPGGLHLSPPKLRLSDLNGGVYGPSASSRIPTTLSTGGSTAQTMQEWLDLIEFHQFHAEKGDPAYMFRLGRLYYGGFGAGGLGGQRLKRKDRSSSLAGGGGGGGVVSDGLWDGGKDFGRSSRWFMRLGRKYWVGDGKEALWNPSWGAFNSRGGTSSNSPVVKKEGTSRVGKLGYYDPKLDKKNDKTGDGEQTGMVAGLAAGYLGRMYLRGEGFNVNYQKAFLWFKRGSTKGDRESHNGLGIMYRDGLGVDRNLKTALMHFHAAAQQDLADAQVNLGKYHFGMGETVFATTFFEAAIRTDGIRQPDQFQAYYYLAELASHSSSSSTDNTNCPVTVSFYKHVVERGDWDHEVWFEAERAREKGDLRKALLGYWIMAERGYEVAQNNVAWILDRDKSRIRVPLLDAPHIGSNETDRIALTYWTRSAAQDNVDALVKLGDYYFKGIGTSPLPSTTTTNDLEGEGDVSEIVGGGPQYEKAATFYQSAGTSRLSAMAMWNLGWMHETGQGVPQDFHLAKRYLDSALETSPSAYFPSTLSLISLYARAAYHVIFSPSDEMNALSLFGRDPDPLAAEQEATGFVPQGSWGFGRAWRDVQRSWGIDPGPEPEVIPIRQGPTNPPPGEPGGQGQQEVVGVDKRRELETGGEPWEYAQDRRNHQRRVGEDEEDEFFIDDEGDLGGTVAIIALCMLLAWLVYFRQRPANQDQNQPQHLNRPHVAGEAVRPAPAAAPGQTPRPPPTPTTNEVPPPPREEEEERLV